MPSDATFSLISQLLALAVGLVGALRAKRSYTIWGWAMLGGIGAMVAHMTHDGQGAFIYLFAIPVIYVLANVGHPERN
jgi:hypothetical protein